MLLCTAGPDETVGSLHRGEDSDHELAPPDLFDQALDHVRGPQAPSVPRRKRQHRGGIVEAVFKNAQGLLCLSLQRV